MDYTFTEEPESLFYMLYHFHEVMHKLKVQPEAFGVQLWNIILMCVTLVYAVEHLLNDAKICCILLYFVCLTL